MTATQPPVTGSPTPSSRRRVRFVAAVVAVVVVNVAMYALLASAAAQRVLDSLAGFTYPGVFVLSLVANIGVFVPVPYNAVVLQVAATSPAPFLVAVAAAAGSALGETTGWLVGRKGLDGLATQGRAGRAVARVRDAAGRPVRAFAGLAAFAAVPNYVFDAAGLAAGAFGVRYPLFLAATFTGRLLRFSLFALLAPLLLAAWADVVQRVT